MTGIFRINSRVRDLYRIVVRLRAPGVAVDSKVAEECNGRFRWALPTSPFRFARRAGLVSVVLTLLAMVAYPGGTLRDPSTRGYSFFRNFLSDLGTTVSWGGHPNWVGAALFVAGFVSLAVAFAGLAAGFVRLWSSPPGGRLLTRAAGVAVMLGCVGLLGAAVTPADQAFSLHEGFGLFAHMTAPIAGLLFAWAAARDARVGTGVAVAWVGFALVPVLLLAVRRWGPGIATDGGLSFHVTVQKLAATVCVTLCVYLSYAADRTVGRSALQRRQRRGRPRSRDSR